MSEPTIGEMLEWLGELSRWVAGEPVRELEAIRAFVERVMTRLSGEYGSAADPKLGELLMAAIRDEVAAMEAEVKQ
jgi:hypothetical protein